MTFINNHIFIFLSLSVALLFGLILLFIVQHFKAKSDKEKYSNLLEDLLADEVESKENLKISFLTKWDYYWNVRLNAIMNVDGKNTGVIPVIFLVVSSVLFFIMFQNIIAAILISCIILYVIGSLLKTRVDKSSNVINGQLPGFLFALKANVQANETPERAIIKVVDSMPSPLYDELNIVKQRVMANATFYEALNELKVTTKSKDLKFLCACIIQATSTGANLETQIDTIQNILTERQKINNELNKAVAATRPSLVIAIIVIPLTFVVTYLFSAATREFWFNDLMSWIIFGLIIFFYLLGVWLTKKLVDSVKNL